MRFSRQMLCATLFIVLCLAQEADAQYRSAFSASPPPSVLSPDPSRWWIGPQLGVNINTHAGDFITDFCQCGFEDGSGVGFSIGAEIGHYLSNSISVALKFVYNDLRADYAYNIVLPTEIVGEGVLDVEYERQNTVVINYLMVNPVLQLHPFDGFYVFAGPAIGVNGTATQEYTLRVADENFEFALGDPATRIIEEDSGDLPRVESLRADLRAGLGLNIKLSRGITFSPEVSYGIPLTLISDDDDWKAEAIHLIGVLKLEL